MANLTQVKLLTRTVRFRLTLKSVVPNRNTGGFLLFEARKLKKIAKANYRSADEIEVFIREREAEAAAMEPGAARQSVLIELAQLRAYASMKRWADKPTIRTLEGQRAGSKKHA